MYREGRARHATGRVVYGPFPIRPWRLVGTAAALFVTSAFTLMGLQSQTVVCRKQRPGITCRAEGFLARDASLSGTTLRSVRIKTQRRGRGSGSEYGTVVLETDRGSAELFEIEGDDARALAARIEAWDRSGRAEIREDLHHSRGVLVMALVALGVAISLLRSALRGMGRVLLDVVDGGSTLVATRSICGVHAGSWSTSLEGAEDVVIEWSDERDFWLSRGQAPRRLGRLVLVAAGGAQRALTSRSWAGRTLHLRAAADLRAALGLAPVRGGVEEQLAAAEGNPERPAWATSASILGYLWLGACCGALGGVATAMVGALAAGMRGRDPVPGSLVGGGSIGGAVLGIAFVVWLARPRVPR